MCVVSPCSLVCASYIPSPPPLHLQLPERYHLVPSPSSSFVWNIFEMRKNLGSRRQSGAGRQTDVRTNTYTIFTEDFWVGVRAAIAEKPGRKCLCRLLTVISNECKLEMLNWQVCVGSIGFYVQWIASHLGWLVCCFVMFYDSEIRGWIYDGYEFIIHEIDWIYTI